MQLVQIWRVKFTRADCASGIPNYGVFGFEYDTDPTSMFLPSYPLLNNAPSNWSTVDLDQGIVQLVHGKVRGYGGLSVNSLINSLKNIVYPHLKKDLIWIKLYLLALSTFMQDMIDNIYAQS